MKIVRVFAIAAAFVGVVGLGAVQGQAGTQAKRPMTFADLMAMKRVTDPQVSPSGKWVMFGVTDVSLEKNTKVNHLWVVALGGEGQPQTTATARANAGILPSGQNDKQSGERQITFGDGESFGRFSPDGKTISLTMKDQIFEMPWNEAKGTVGDAIQVTNVAGGADGAVWSPDSKRLMFVGTVWPECSVKGGSGGTTTTTEILSAGAQNDGSTGFGGGPVFV
ncbi:MAG: hypothetical protein M3O31_10650, partial [Acidobacteriota bacterium]|nr:hypothetical protein [Acidobacteriota bacterium]